ncbi:hypothetical protein [Gracilibacillus timonensis]|uniref:hypothetical protein n=1 Tax=Gracilibacillus timonensis TaxID=1816696 RepID=UPI000A8CA965|nr:hypothetical protein [Gracilibacillus timonensis]
MKDDFFLDPRGKINDIIFGEKDSKKVHANNFLNMFVDLILENDKLKNKIKNEKMVNE